MHGRGDVHLGKVAAAAEAPKPFRGGTGATADTSSGEASICKARRLKAAEAMKATAREQAKHQHTIELKLGQVEQKLDAFVQQIDRITAGFDSSIVRVLHDLLPGMLASAFENVVDNKGVRIVPIFPAALASEAVDRNVVTTPPRARIGEELFATSFPEAPALPARPRVDEFMLDCSDF